MRTFRTLPNVYCTLCDQYFVSNEARTQHVQFSENHPLCRPCGRRFINKNALRVHLNSSPRHHYCAVCDIEYHTLASLRVHLEFATVHRSDLDDGDFMIDDDVPWDDDLFEDDTPSWIDNVRHRRYPEVTQPARADFNTPPGVQVVPEVPPESPPLDGIDEDDFWDEPDEPEHLEEMREQYYSAVRAATAMRRDAHYFFTDTVRGIPAEIQEKPDDLRGNASHHHDKSSKGELEEPVVTFTCSLCLEAPQNTSTTRCGHVFCTPCIHKALKFKRSCPVCRTPAVPTQLRKIYLTAS